MSYSQHDPNTNITSSIHSLDVQQIFLPWQVYFFVEELFKRYFIVCCNDVIGLWLVYSLNRCGNNMSLCSIWAPHSSPGWLLYLGSIKWSCSKITSVGRWATDLFLSLSPGLWHVQRKNGSFISNQAKKKGQRICA